MAKVFRFHNEGQVSGWGRSKLQERHIDQIKDPNGSSASKEITSIPSPFARIDLVKTAFQEVVKSGNLSGKTIYHKMVSHALDIGQIFFNIEKYKENVEIITWDSNVDLLALVNADNPQHQTLGKSLQLYLNQDSKGGDIYNFSQLDKVYLLNYKKGPNPMNIIGGSSTATLFFTSANDFNLPEFKEESHQLLGQEFVPLNLRDPEFVKYIFALRHSSPPFSNQLPELYNYLNLVYTALQGEILNDVRTISNTTLQDYPNLNIAGGGTVVKVLGMTLKRAKDRTDLIKKSDFLIKAEKAHQENIPLLLPNHKNYNHDLTYINTKWDQDIAAPHVDSKPLSNRKLPVTGDSYPYLTISDLLEPVLIKTEFPIDRGYYFNGNFRPLDGKEKGFLLPIRPLYFQFFTEDSLSNSINGEKRFELEELHGGNIQATLRIPIQNNGVITYKRTYYRPVNHNAKPDYNESENKGAIIENRINLGISPSYKFPENISKEYNVALYDADFNSLFENNSYRVEFYNSTGRISNINAPTQRRKKSEENIDMLAYVVNENFSFLRVNHQFGSGIILPKFKKESNGIDQFTFAIDFGTTNTHIEYKINDGQSMPFEFTTKEQWHFTQLIDFEKFDAAYLKRAQDDLLPQIIGESSEAGYKFPQRTAVAYHQSTDFLQPLISMGNVAIPFKYEKASFDLNTQIKTNLKWNNSNTDHKLRSVFFEQIVKMIRNKILLNNGDLAKTKVIWSYPASMSTGNLNQISSELSLYIHNILGRDISIEAVCESLTPFYYYVYEEGKSALVRPTVSIDIGGGTSDVAIYENNIPVLFTSYRFAGDAIFGDNYNRNIKLNGFVQKYFKHFLEVLNSNGSGLSGILSSFKEGNSNDAINALFSLEDNKQLKQKKLNVSFLEELKKDNELKVIFLLFFLAHIFHIAKIFKAKGLKLPEQFAFSGTASKLLSILDASKNKPILKDLIIRTFKHVLKDNSFDHVEILWAEKPKELSSKGGLHIDEGQNLNVKNIKEVLLTDNILLSKEPNISYATLDQLEKRALGEYSEFLDFFFTLDKEISYMDLFSIKAETLSYTKDLLNTKKENLLKVGISERIKQIGGNPNSEIDETLFFYPLTGCLGELAYALQSNLVSR